MIYIYSYIYIYAAYTPKQCKLDYIRSDHFSHLRPLSDRRARPPSPQLRSKRSVGGARHARGKPRRPRRAAPGVGSRPEDAREMGKRWRDRTPEPTSILMQLDVCPILPSHRDFVGGLDPPALLDEGSRAGTSLDIPSWKRGIRTLPPPAGIVVQRILWCPNLQLSFFSS